MVDVGWVRERLPERDVLSLHALAIAVVIASLAATIWVASDVFDRLPHVEDEMALLFDARAIAGGALVPPLPPNHNFFTMPFVLIGDGIWYGIYPPGYPLALALGVLAGHPWIVNPILAALTVGMVYLLGIRLYDSPRLGLLAAALLALSPFFLLQAGSQMAHVAALFWLTLFVLLFDGARREWNWWVALLAGLAIGMAFLIRPLSAVAFVLPFAVWGVVDLIRMPRQAVWVYPYMAVSGSLGGLAYLWYNLHTTGDPLLTGQEALWDFNRIGFGSGIGPGGYHGFDGGVLVTRVNLQHLSEFLFGWPAQLSLYAVALGVAVMFAGLYWRVKGISAPDALPWAAAGPTPQPASREVWDVVLFSAALAIVLVHAAYWTTGFMYGPRFYFEAMAALVLLTARGLFGAHWMIAGAVQEALPRLRFVRPGVAVAGLVVLALLFLHAHANFTPRWFDEYRGWYNIDRSELRVVEAPRLRNAVVFVYGQHWTDFAPFLSQNDPQLTYSVIYAKDLGDGPNQALLEQFPDREFYRFDGENLTRWEP